MAEVVKHTPGPFRVEVPPSSSGYCRAIYAVRESGDDVFVAYVGNWKQPPAIEIADAALFVAAPELLSAAKAALFVLNIVSQREPGTNEAGAIAGLDSAIAKAEGEETARQTEPSCNDLRQWSKALTDSQLSAALEEMRSRGAAIAIYDVGEIRTMYDGSEFSVDLDDWWDEENRAHVEESMCEAARAIFERELEPNDGEAMDNG